MADDNTKLILSLEARFDKFEKAMLDATAVVDRQTKVIEQRFTAMTNVISDKLSGIQGALVGRLGTLGNVLTALGPMGTAAAVGIGVLAAALNETANAADRVAAKAIAIRQFSVGTGFSVQETQGVRRAIIGLGLDTEQVQKAIEKFTVELNELKTTGGGPLLKALQGIDQELVNLMLNAKSSKEAFFILVQAMSQMSTQARNALARSAGGRGGIGAFAEIAADFEKFKKLFEQGLSSAKTEDQIKETVDAARELITAQKLMGAEWDKAFPTEAFMRNRINAINEITTALKFFNDTVKAGADAVQAEINRRRERAGGLPLKIDVFPPTRPLPPEETVPDLRNQEQANRLREERLALLNQEIIRLQTLKDLAGPGFTAAQNAQLEKLVLTQKQLQLANPTPAQVAAVAAGQKAISEAQQLQTIAMREQLGVATQDEMLKGRLIVINRQLSQQILTGADAERAALIARKDALEKYEAQLVRVSNLPGLTRLTLDLQNNAKQLDEISTKAIGAFGDNMADAILGTKKFADAFKGMTDIIMRELVKLALQKAILLPLNQAFGFTPAGRMAGGPVSAGAPYIVGERGPELFVPGSSGNVVPNKAMASGAGAMVQQNVVINDYSGQARVKQTQTPEGGGVEVFIPAIEQMLAGGVTRGRGALSKSMTARQRGTNLYG